MVKYQTHCCHTATFHERFALIKVEDESLAMFLGWWLPFTEPGEQNNVRASTQTTCAVYNQSTAVYN